MNGLPGPDRAVDPASGSKRRAGILQRKPHHELAAVLLARVGEAHAFVERTRRSVTRHDAGQELLRARPGAYVGDDLLERATSEAAPLVAAVDHEAPEIVRLLRRVIVEHDEADRRVAVVDRTEPGHVAREIRLGDRARVRCDEALLPRADLEGDDGAHRLPGDFAQRDVAHFFLAGGHRSCASRRVTSWAVCSDVLASTMMAASSSTYCRKFAVK